MKDDRARAAGDKFYNMSHLGQSGRRSILGSATPTRILWPTSRVASRTFNASPDLRLRRRSSASSTRKRTNTQIQLRSTKPSPKKTQNTKQVFTAWLPDLHEHALPDGVQGLLWPQESKAWKTTVQPYLSLPTHHQVIIFRQLHLAGFNFKWKQLDSRHRNRLIHGYTLVWFWVMLGRLPNSL